MKRLYFYEMGSFFLDHFATLQALFAGLAGALPGARLGALSQVIYLLIGIIGLPVFAGVMC